MIHKNFKQLRTFLFQKVITLLKKAQVQKNVFGEKNSFLFSFCANCYKFPKNVIAYKLKTIFY